MRLVSQELSSVTCVRKPLRIDYESLGPGLICFVGKNGSGKTTTAEIPAVALWQVFPSRPDFYERFHGRGAYAQAEFEDRGRRYAVRIQVDAEKRATERYLFLDGQSIASRAAEFKTAVKEHFGSLDAFLVGPFAAQNRRGNFIEKSPSERKKVIAEMLGLQRWDARHERAKKRRAAVELQLEKARGWAEAIERELISRHADRRVTLRLELAELEALRRRLDEELARLRTIEASRRQAVEAARAKENEIRSLEQVYRSAQAEHQTLASQVKAAEDRISAHDWDSQKRFEYLGSVFFRD
jgi:exonuclease SbcC